jgi:hypothetical protein
MMHAEKEKMRRRITNHPPTTPYFLLCRPFFCTPAKTMQHANTQIFSPSRRSLFCLSLSLPPLSSFSVCCRFPYRYNFVRYCLLFCFSVRQERHHHHSSPKKDKSSSLHSNNFTSCYYYCCCCCPPASFACILSCSDFISPILSS